MKKFRTIIIMMIVVSVTMFSGTAVFAEEAPQLDDDAYYYYSVKVTTKIGPDDLSKDAYVYYGLHGVKSGYVNFVTSLYSIDGIPADNSDVCIKPGVDEQTNVLVFRSDEPVIGVRLLLNGYYPSKDLSYDKIEYYLALDEQAQQPGLQNVTILEKMRRIEGFKDGGEMILSDLMDATTELKYDAPPAFSGAADGGEYYTTQKVVVKDSNLASVTLDGNSVDIANGEAIVTLPGNSSKTYAIVAKDAADHTSSMTVVMHELNELLEPVSGITESNVKADHKDAILETLDKVGDVIENEPDASADEKKRLNEMKEELEGLLSRIDEAAAQKNAVNIEEVEGITADNVKPSDKDALLKAEADLKKLLEEFGGNYTDAEKKDIEDELKRINNVKAVLEEMSKPADTTSPNTGDNSNMLLWITLFFISGGAVITLTVVDRKRKAVKR